MTKILTEASTIAMVGALSNSERPSHPIMKRMLDAGYRVIPPVMPGSGSLLALDNSCTAIGRQKLQKLQPSLRARVSARTYALEVAQVATVPS